VQDGPSISQLKSAAAGVIRRVSSKARPSTCAPRLEKHGIQTATDQYLLW